MNSSLNWLDKNQQIIYSAIYSATIREPYGKKSDLERIAESFKPGLRSACVIHCLPDPFDAADFRRFNRFRFLNSIASRLNSSTVLSFQSSRCHFV